jgi:hypothetical protein
MGQVPRGFGGCGAKETGEPVELCFELGVEAGCVRILRVIAAIHPGAVRAHDVIRMLSRDGHPTQLGEAIAHYGRIDKTLHVLRTADDPATARP